MATVTHHIEAWDIKMGASQACMMAKAGLR